MGIAAICFPFGIPNTSTSDKIALFAFGLLLTFLTFALTGLPRKEKEKMNPKIDFGRITKIDLAIIVHCVIILTFTALNYFNNFNLLIAYNIFGNVLLLAWLYMDGHKSILWDFLPPFWPWGKILNFKSGRIGLVLLMSATSIFAMVTLIQDKN